MSFLLAIIGRPNVGKSTLFNRLAGQKLALVDDQPGVTRDLREGLARLGPHRFQMLDTAGLEMAQDESLSGRMRKLTERAIEEADACLFMIDARIGVTPLDTELAEMLRRSGKTVLLGANKAEGRAADAGLIEAWELGLGEPIAISAEHGIGIDELSSQLGPILAAYEANLDSEEPLSEEAQSEVEMAMPGVDKPLQLAVVGRPNAGKSTLINQIIGDDRLLTGPEAGITRDAIAQNIEWAGTPMRIFDTAGLRKKAKVQEKLEKLSVADGLRAVRFAEVVVVLLDANIPFETQDLRIADLAEREGRAVVIAVNKWDLVEDPQARLAALKRECTRLLPQLKGVPLIALSAASGKGLDRLHEAILAAYRVWNARISTGRLNRWLEGMIASHPPPAPGGIRIKLKYITQAKARPPSFAVMCSHPEELPESYRRYLMGGLRSAFGLEGTPIRISFRSRSEKNPYRNKKSKQPSKLRKHLK